MLGDTVEVVSHQLSAAFAAGFVTQDTCAALLEQFPGAKVLSIAVDGPEGLLTTSGNFIQPGHLTLMLLRPDQCAAGRAMASSTTSPMQFVQLHNPMIAALTDVRHAVTRHGCVSLLCAALCRPQQMGVDMLVSAPYLGVLSVGFDHRSPDILDRSSAQLAAIGCHMAPRLANDSASTLQNVRMYFLPFLGITGVKKQCSCCCPGHTCTRHRRRNSHSDDSTNDDQGNNHGGNSGDTNDADERRNGCNNEDPDPPQGGSSGGTAGMLGTERSSSYRISLDMGIAATAPPGVPDQAIPQPARLPAPPPDPGSTLPQPVTSPFAGAQAGKAVEASGQSPVQGSLSFGRPRRRRAQGTGGSGPSSRPGPSRLVTSPTDSSQSHESQSGSGSGLYLTTYNSQESSKSSTGAFSAADLDETQDGFLMAFASRALESKYLLWVASHQAKADVIAAVVSLCMHIFTDMYLHLSRKTAYLFSLSYVAALAPLIAMACNPNWYFRHREAWMLALMIAMMTLNVQVCYPQLLREVLAKPLPRGRMLSPLHVLRLSGVEALALLPLFHMVRFKAFLWVQPLLWLLALTALPKLIEEVYAGQPTPGYLLPSAALVQGVVGCLLPGVLIRYAELRSRRLFLQWAHAA